MLGNFIFLYFVLISQVSVNKFVCIRTDIMLHDLDRGDYVEINNINCPVRKVIYTVFVCKYIGRSKLSRSEFSNCVRHKNLIATGRKFQRNRINRSYREIRMILNFGSEKSQDVARIRISPSCRSFPSRHYLYPVEIGKDEAYFHCNGRIFNDVKSKNFPSLFLLLPGDTLWEHFEIESSRHPNIIEFLA